MVVDVNVKRLDLVRFNFATLFRIRANLVMLGLFWVVIVFGFLTGSGWSLADINIVLALVLSLFMAAVVFLGFFVFLMTFTLLSVTDKSGWIGRRRYSVEDKWIREVTQANDSLYAWGSVNDVREAAGMLMVRVSQYNFLLAPKHGFTDPGMYDSFCADVKKRWREAQ